MAQSFQLTHAGFYQIRFANGRDALIAVNPDSRESDLEAVPVDVLKLWSGSGTADSGSTNPESQEKNSVSSLWWWFMLLVMIAALAESIVASRYLGTQREAV